ncbi:MAG: hypothetical protein LBF26_00005, partial [Puniceicoccales bacterium]|nr:hypothetical protein [Puniceicoccales bacterium]
PQPQSRQAPTAQRRGPCDEIAELFKINDNDLVIIESGEASKLTLAQISIKLHEIFKSLLDEKLINIIVDSIFEYAWTLKDVDTFTSQWTQLPPCIMAYFDLNKLNEKITVTSGEENPEKVIGDSLDKVLESVAFVISSDTRSEVVTKIIDGMTGSELHKYLINLVHPGGQQPVTSGKSDPLPTASQVQLPQVVSPSDHGLIQAFGANHNSAPNGYVRIHARCDNNCLFNALAIALTLYGTRSRNITGELCAILEIMWELAITGTTNRAQNIVQLAANLESRLQRTFVDTRLIRRAAAAEEEIQRALGFEPDTLAACKTEQQGNSTQLAVTDITAERLIRELWHQTQLLAQHYLRELLAKFELPNPLPASLTTSLAAIQGDIESGNRRRLTRGLSPRPTAGSIEEYRRNYTAQIGQWGEIPDIILIAICFECPVYVVNQGAMNVIAFGPDGSLIENPNLHDIRDVAIVFWNNGTNATDGSHWDLCVPADAGVHQIWHATD